MVQLPQAGSARTYFRVTHKGKTYIGTWNENLAENEAFFCFANHFRSKGLAVPELLAISEDRQSYLQEDIGTESLYSRLPTPEAPFSSELEDAYNAVLVALVRLQLLGHEELDYSKAYPVPKFDRLAMRWDLDYFKHFFLKLQDIAIDEYALEHNFQDLLDFLEDTREQFFMHRDCQSRNIFFQNGKVCFIDFQGGREGPAAYDLASLLWQAKARIPQDVRDRLLGRYIQEFRKLAPINEEAFRKSYYGFVLLRQLQVLGAYGFRGLVQQKPHFLQSIPLALANVKWLEENCSYPFDLDELWRSLKLAGQKLKM